MAMAHLQSDVHRAAAHSLDALVKGTLGAASKPAVSEARLCRGRRLQRFCPLITWVFFFSMGFWVEFQ